MLSSAAAAETTLGPAPVDEDGRFVNEGGPIERPGPSVTVPFFLRRIRHSFGARPEGAERVENDGSFLRENARHSRPTVTWVGHATLLVQMSHVTFLTDPIWSETATPFSLLGPRRLVDPGIRLEDLPAIDFVLVSHNHYDHLDEFSLIELAARRSETRFLVPKGNAATLRELGLRNVHEFDWGESTQVGEVTVYCLPSRHWSRRGLLDGRKALWASWAVISSERRFYFGGDTGFFDGFKRIGKVLGPFDLVALPIGAYEPKAMMSRVHLNPEQAVQAALDLRARRTLAIHFGTFDLTEEPIDEPPQRFSAAAKAAGFTADEAWILRIGESRPF